MGKLNQLHDCVEEILQGKIASPLDARRKVEEIVAAPSTYSNAIFNWISCITMTCIGVAFLGGNAGEIIAGVVAGIMVGLWKMLCEKIGKVGSNLIPLTATLIAGGIGILAKWIFETTLHWNHVDVLLVVMAGIIVELPGMEFVIAISELNMANMLAGIVRLVSVLVTIIQLGFGMLLSGRVSALVFGADAAEIREDTQPWLVALLVPPFAIASMIDLHIPFLPITVLFVMLSSYMGFFSAGLLTDWIGWEAGTVISAFAVGVIGHLYSIITKRPNLIVSACGVLLLIPGIISDQEVRGMLDNDASLGVQSIMQSLLISFALAVGLMISDFVSFFSEECTV
jgi:uncharacterized membrane protein YjjB (DUF3815 family)